MAITSITARGSAVSNANGTTLSVSPSANIVVGKVLLVASASDNNQTTDGQSSFHTVSDSKGNTWIKITEYTETDGAADDGVSVSLWLSLITTQINTTDTVTLTLGASKTDKIITLSEATIASGKRLVLEQVGIGQGTVSASVSSLPSREYLLFANFGAEGEDNAKTPSTNYTELYDLISSTQGVLDVNIAIHVQYRVATLTSDTASIADWTFTNAMATLSALYESDPISAASALGTLTATGFVPTVTASNNQTATAGLGQVTANGFAPSVTATNNQSVTAGLGQVTANGFAPTVTASNNQSFTAGLGQLTATGFVPTATPSDNKNIPTFVGVLSVTGYLPTVAISDNKKAQTDVGVLTLTGYLPTVAISDNQVVQTNVGSVIATGYLPTVLISDNKKVTADVGVLNLNGFSPSINSTIRTDVGQVQIDGFGVVLNYTIGTSKGELIATGYEPTVDISQFGPIVYPENGQLIVSGFEPTIKTTIQTNVGQLVVVGFIPVVLTPKLVVTELGQLSVVGYEATVYISVNVYTQKGEAFYDGFEPDILLPAYVVSGVGELEFVGYEPKIKGIFTFETDIWSGIQNNQTENSQINNGNVYSGASQTATLKSKIRNVF